MFRQLRDWQHKNPKTSDLLFVIAIALFVILFISATIGILNKQDRDKERQRELLRQQSNRSVSGLGTFRFEIVDPKTRQKNDVV
jgi:hypothetical protein